MSNPTETQPAHANHAVARCCDAFNRTFKVNIAINQTKAAATECAATAFREAMPPLVGHDNIRDFIACVAQGILLGAFDSAQSARLLYAAQVALTAYRAKVAPHKLLPA